MTRTDTTSSSDAVGGVFIGVGTALLIPGIYLWAAPCIRITGEGGPKLGRVRLAP